jgi:hypothetical protein
MSANTFWVAWHRPNGITTDMALAISNVLREWSLKLTATADQLEALAKTYDDLERQGRK